LTRYARFVCNEDELAALEPAYLERQASLHPLVMEEVEQEASYDGPQSTDPEVLARIDAPVRRQRVDQLLRVGPATGMT
jgi:hypothetical protein